MTLRFRLLPALLASLAFVAGCDSNNPGSSLRDLDGSYRLTELVFVTDGTGVADADVGARLDLAGSELRIFGGDGDATLITRFTVGPNTGTRRTEMTATASRGSLTLTAVSAEDQDELAQILLPPTFSLQYDAATLSQLSGSPRRNGVNLEQFDPIVFQGQRSVNGNVEIRFDRQ